MSLKLHSTISYNPKSWLPFTWPQKFSSSVAWVSGHQNRWWSLLMFICIRENSRQDPGGQKWNQKQKRAHFLTEKWWMAISCCFNSDQEGSSHKRLPNSLAYRTWIIPAAISFWSLAITIGLFVCSWAARGFSWKSVKTCQKWETIYKFEKTKMLDVMILFWSLLKKNPNTVP